MSNFSEKYILEPIDFDPFAGPEIIQLIPLAKPQEEIWLSCKLGGDDANRSYNESVSLKLKGQLNRQALETALLDLILRHESLRSTFKSDGTQVLIHKNWPLNLIYQDLSAQTSLNQQKNIDQFVHQEALLTYNLSSGPLFKTVLFKLSANEHYFTFSAHHIICDGWSLGILLQDLSKLYSALNQGLQPQLPEAPQMSLYISEQINYAETNDYQQNKTFWLDQFNCELPELNLPLDFPRPALRSYKSRRDDFILKPQLTSALKKTGVKTGTGFVVTLLAAFEVLLHKITNQPELVLGLPASGQAASGYYGMTGHCVNLLPLKSFLSDETTFGAYLKKRKSEILDALDHQQFSLGSLLKLLKFKRDPSRVPLVPVVFNMDMNLDSGVTFNGLTRQLFYNPKAYETFEIFLNASGSEQELTFEWSYNTQLFKSETIAWMMHSFENLIKTMILEPELLIGSVALPLKKQLSHQLIAWNNTAAAYPQVSLPELISQNLKKHAVKTAIRFFDQEISNADLLSKSNRLAALLLDKGIKKGDLIGIALNRSIEMVLTIVAVLKTGAAYIPLDPSYPQDRINFMMQDSDARFLIVNREYQGEFSAQAEKLVLEDIIRQMDAYLAEEPDVEILGSDLAYILYTSGSTGRPKGVQVAHHNVVNFLNSMNRWPGISTDDRMLAHSTVSFDIAGLELFLPLISGAEMILTDTKTAKDGFELLKLMQSAKISLIQATPATFRMMLEAGWKEQLPVRVFCCGEALQPDLAKKLTAVCAGLWNMYGPTETTIYSTGKQIFNDDAIITIGRPIDNTQIYILDERFNLMEEGKIGEIFISGEGVARGYLNQPELTAVRFPNDIYKQEPGKKMYRTGDVGRFLENGEIEYLGRADHQVKIRGHRVELGEVEAQLSRLENINQVVVIVREDQPGNQQLVAYVLAPFVQENNKKHWTDQWKTSLKEALPPFMVPAQIVILPQFPLTPNHKIDRKALPKPVVAVPDVAGGFTGPRNEAEKIVSDIWCDVLGIPAICIFDNFFEIGGHSLTAVQIMSRLEKETGKRLPLASLFESSTIEALSLLLKIDGKYIVWDSLVTIKATGSKMPVYIIHGSDSNVLNFKGIAHHLDADQPVYGLQAKGLNGSDKPSDVMEEIVARYVKEIVTHNPTGPYAVAGYSFGGYAAVEMARQLRLLGKEVKMIAVFDTNAEDHSPDKNALKKVLGKIIRQLKKSIWIINSLLKHPKKTIDYQLAFLTKKFKPMTVSLGLAEEEVIDEYLLEMKRIREQNDKAYYNYLIKPFDGTVDLFRAKTRIYFIDDFKFLGWKKYALKGVKVHVVPGDHETMLKSPNDKEFARILQNCLDKSA